MLGIGCTIGSLDMIAHKYTHTRFHNYIESPIFNQPELSEKAYKKNENGNIKGCKDSVFGYIIKTDFITKAIKEIDDKFLNIIFCHYGDFFLFFLLTKRAKTLKYIKILLYVTIKKKVSGDSLENYFTKEKWESRSKNYCQNIFGYIEFVLAKSNDDVKLASFLIENSFLKNDCNRKIHVRDQTINICKLVLENKFIENGLKDKIKFLLKSINENKD